ncbi:MAG TPA: hypothetical protein PLG17_10775 [Thermodesulfobacteriota bacterium]|nr:hypothetical protein [Thermodesulfobacteriota bacterium]
MEMEVKVITPETDLGLHTISIKDKTIWFLSQDEITSRVRQALLNAYWHGYQDGQQTAKEVSR